MNNPDDMPIDVTELIEWVTAYKSRKSLSWTDLGRVSGIPAGTLSNLKAGSYGGNIQEQAKRLYRFRQQVESQEARMQTALGPQQYIETPASRTIQMLLEVAHMGRITVAAMGPGTGKTITAKRYAASMSNVWMATMRKSTAELAPMINHIMNAMELVTKQTSKQARSQQVTNYATGRNGLLIIDEANHLVLDSLEELRAWNDVPDGVGIALLGNEELMMRIRGGQNRHAYARLRSRIANYCIQDMPTEADAVAFLDGLEIDERPIRKLLIGVAMSAEHGGLREVHQILASAHVLAIGDEEPLGLGHVQEAMRSRAITQMRRVA